MANDTVPQLSGLTCKLSRMTDKASPASTAGEDFDAAKAIVEKLTPLNRERQERVLRWVSEILGIGIQPAPVLPVTPAAPPATSPTNPPATIATSTSSTTNIRSFIEQKNPRSDVQFVTAVAHFYRFEAPEEQRRATIDAAFTREATRLANWERLAKPLKTLNNAVNRGYLDRQARGQFAISTVGENLVARTLPGGNDAAAKKKTTKTANSNRKKTPKR